MFKLLALIFGLYIVIYNVAKCQFPDENARPVVDEVETAKYA